MAVSEVNFTLLADEGIDDLPRTLRRERDARERAAREEEERKRRATRTHDFEPLGRASLRRTMRRPSTLAPTPPPPS